MRRLAVLLWLATGCDVVDLQAGDVGSVSQPGLATRSTDDRWRMDAEGTYTIQFYANPANGFVVPPAGAKCSTTATQCNHGVALRQAMDEYERLTAIRFLELDAPLPAEAAGNYLHYIDCNAGTSHTYGPTNIPADVQEDLEACDENIMSTLNVRLGTDFDGRPLPNDFLIVLRQDVDFLISGPPVPYHIPLHESGHAIGLSHENKRSDADQAGVNLFTDCVGGSMTAFTPAPAANWRPLGPYDIDSMMQYPSTTKCTKAGESCHAPGGDGCSCFPLLLAVDPATPVGGDVVSCTSPAGTTQKGRLIFPGGGFSDEDLNAIYQMYPPRLGQSSAGDGFGEAVAAGDFDHDGYTDLAVGAPGDRSGGPAAGAVYLFKGTFNGLQPWRRLVATAREAGDDFGAALAVGRLDDDGTDDLVVGAPHIRPREGDARAGGVFIYYGKRRGLGDRQFLHQENAGFDGSNNQADERFGAAIAIGDFDGVGRPEIAIGAPGDGAGGHVYVVKRLAGGGYTRFDRLGDSRGAGDRFGASLLAADLGGSTADELMVGSPENGTPGGAGHVYVYRKAQDGFGAGTSLAEPNGPVAGDRFGSALASGIFAHAGVRKLVVGAPGRASARGNVWLFKLSLAGGGVAVTSFDRIAQVDAGLSGQAGAELGSALAVGDFDDDGRDDLAVGAPRYDVGVLSQNGAVSLLRGLDGTVGSPQVRFEKNLHGAPEILDQFGSALAVGQFNGASKLDLAIGTPGRDPGNHGDDFAGAVWPLRGQEGAMPDYTGDRDSFTDYLDQEYRIQR